MKILFYKKKKEKIQIEMSSRNKSQMNQTYQLVSLAYPPDQT